MNRILFALAIFLTANSTRAEFLLAEYGWNQPDPITLPAGFSMSFVDDILGYQASISNSLTSPDDTMVMTMFDYNEHPEYINQFNRVLARMSNMSRRVYITNDEHPINQFGFLSIDGIWFPDFDPNDGYHATAHVPPAINPPFVGLGLHGYWITRVKHVVTPAGQTVYFYGGTIPEPAAGILATVAGITCIGCRRRFSNPTT